MKTLKLKALMLVREKWRDVEVIIDSNGLNVGNLAIPFKEIEDLEMVEIAGRRAIRIRRGEDYYFDFGAKQNSVFKYLAYNLKSDRFAVYFLSPAFRGGVLVSGARWEKGYLSITDRAIWFISPNKQVRIPLNSVGSVRRDVRTVGQKERKVLAVTHVEGSEVIVSFVLCPETTLEMLHEYLRQLIEKAKPRDKLSELEEQVLQMVYTGLDSASIESMLGITTEQLNAIYDKFVALGLARVVKVRKEIELTPKGVAVVSDVVGRGG
ncbi:MAG: CheF family chemotaxis protein [Archaeoglobaceae archaeon]